MTRHENRTSTRRTVDLTRRQNLILLENALYPGFPCNCELRCLSVDGALDVARLQSAFHQVCLQMDTLRARLRRLGGSTVLQVGDSVPDTFRVADIGGGSVDDYLKRIGPMCFDLDQPLAWCHVLTDGPDRTHIVLHHSHLITDGRDAVIFFELLEKAYQSPDPMMAARWDYCDHKRAAPDPGAEAFWAEALRAPVAPISLYGHSAASQRGALRRLKRSFPAESADRLLQRPEGLSPSVAMTAITAAALVRASGEPEVALGIPFANRPKGTEDLPGMFMEILPNRLSIDTACSLMDIAADIVADAARSRPYRTFSVAGGDSGHQVMMNYRPVQPDRFAGLPAALQMTSGAHWIDAKPHVTAEGRASVGLQVSVIRSANGRPEEIYFDFDTGTWPDVAVHDAFADDFLTIAQGMLADPHMSVGAIPLFSEDSVRASVLAADTRDLPPEAHMPVFQRVAAMAETAPGRRAVLYEGKDLSYGVLWLRVQHVARALQRLGLKPGQRVVVCMDPSENLPVALLGVLLAGGVYVPLDPELPEARRQIVLEDSTPTLIVTDRPLKEGGVQQVLLSDLLAAHDGTGETPLPSVTASDPAYLLFTSGSTGRPKGVMVRHGNLSSLLSAMQTRPGVTADDRVLALTTVSFDIAALELFLPLVTGATCVIARSGMTRDPNAVMRLVRDAGITVMQATPTFWRMLVEVDARAPGVKVLTGGEALAGDLAVCLQDRFGPVWNMYGPTETTIWSACGEVRTQDKTPPSLGTPITGTTLRVCTPEGAIVPRGTPGELVISGAGVTAGYWARPELTEKAFIQKAGEDAYRTGDMVRLTEQGDLQYLGRGDQQIKLAGYRIELGEIEARIAEAPGVSAAVAQLWSTDGGPDRLIGYWTGENSPQMKEQIAAHLSGTLPGYMQPHVLLHLDRLPMTPNGKLDRKGLTPASARETQSFTDTCQAAFETDLEHAVAQAFDAVLSGVTADPLTDFFKAGGDSLGAIQLSLQLEVSTGRKVEIPAIFQHRTVRAVAAAISGELQDDNNMVVTLRQGAVDMPPVYCVSGIELYQPLAERLAKGRAIHGVYAPKEAEAIHRKDPLGDLQFDVDGITDQYVEAIRRHAPSDGVHIAGFSYGGRLSLEIAAKLEAAGCRVRSVVMLDTISKFGAYRGPIGLYHRLKERWHDVRPPAVVHGHGTNVERAASRLLAQAKRMDAQSSVAGPSANVPILLVRCKKPSRLWGSERFAPDYGWAERLRRDVVLTHLPGAHMEMLSPPYVDDLSEKLSVWFAETELR